MGRALKGGEERVEEVRVGLLGFRRDVEEVRRAVGEMEVRVGRLVEERRVVRRDIALGRRCLAWERALTGLEDRLAVQSPKVVGRDEVAGSDAESDGDDFDDYDDDDGQDEDTGGLKAKVQDFLLLRQLEQGVGSEHPLVIANQSRVTKVRNTLLLDLGTALRQARARTDSGQAVMKVVGLYRDMDAAKEAVQVLKSLKRFGR